MTETEAFADQARHVFESPLHQKSGWYEPKVTR
jgi:hypothetical protein